MTLLDKLAKENIELLLTKHQYHDIWDVYWYADTPFYKRTDLYVNRYKPVYPYKPAPCMPEMSLKEILDKANILYDKLFTNNEFENENEDVDDLLAAYGFIDTKMVSLERNKKKDYRAWSNRIFQI